MRLDLRIVHIILGLWLVGACTPLVIAPGPDQGAPQLTTTGLVMRDGHQLPVTRFDPPSAPKAVIIALHGFNDYARHFDLAGPFWADQGIATIAYDQRGFGRGANAGFWAEPASMINDARQAVTLARAHFPGARVILLGVSMGGAVALSASARDLNADGLVLVSPALWGWRVMNPFYQTTLWLSAHVAPEWTVTGRGLGRMPSDNIAFLRRMGRDPYVIKETRIDAVYGLTNLMDQALDAPPKIRLPSLILFGDNDQIVPESPVREALAQITAPCRFVYAPGGYHMLLVDKSAERIWRLIADFALGHNVPDQPGCAIETLEPAASK